jgi:hypothetical protein
MKMNRALGLAFPQKRSKCFFLVGDVFEIRKLYVNINKTT